MKRLSRRVAGDAPGRDRHRGPRRPRRRPLPRRDVHFALESDGWNCTFECEAHVSASGGARRGLRPARGAPPGDPRRRRGSASCPNLLQRPGLRRSAGRETLIFRASARRRSRRETPLQQIWTRPAPNRHRSPTSITPCPPIPVTAPTRAPHHRSRRERGSISLSSHEPFSPGAVVRGRGVSSGRGQRRDRHLTRENVC
mgnify:CR=1 FL=1